MAIDDDDPFAAAEGTIIRPKPGGGRRSATESGPTAAMSADAPAPEQAARFAPTAELGDFVTGGRNPILQAATPLLVIAARLQSTVVQADIAALRTQTQQQIRQFDDRLRAANVCAEDALGARFILCTFFDSAVLNTPWGAHSNWSGQSLLIVFHKVQDGGKTFFEILTRISSDPARYIDLLEFQYVCIVLGFIGKYRLEERGAEKLADVQHNLFRTIRDVRKLKDAELSSQWRGVEDRRNPIFRYLPWWIIGALGLAALVVAFVIYDARLKSQGGPIKELLAATAVPVQYTAPAAPAASRLKQLLQTQEQAGQLGVEDFGDKSIVTLTGAELFRSGSAQVNPASGAILAAVAQALNQVPGRIFVVGHTDDQPVHSLQFADNFELSRERAVAVAKVLMKSGLTDSSRVEWLGAGATQPRYKPVNTAENRARNRRVEIIQVEKGSAP